MNLRLSLLCFTLFSFSLQAADLLPQCNHMQYQEAESLLEKIKKGDNEAYYSMAQLCEQTSRGYNPSNNYHLARHYYLKAVENKDERAFFRLGKLFELGRGGEKDLVTAFKYYNQDPSDESLYELGQFYENGWGIEKNELKALEYYKRGRDNACKLAYAIALEEGRLGAEPNLKKAVSLYDAIDDSQDYSKDYLKRSFKGEALFRKARLGERGKVPDLSNWEIIRTYQESSQHDHYLARTRLGEIYESGLLEEKKDTYKAKKYYEDAQHGNPEASMHLIRLAQTDRYNSDRYQPAFYYALTSWNLGSRLAEKIIVLLARQALRRYDSYSHYYSHPGMFLAKSHQKGGLLPKNPALSYSWAQMAAKNGSVQSLKFFAELLWTGQDVPQDLLKALDYYKKYGEWTTHNITHVGDLTGIPVEKSDRQTFVANLVSAKAHDMQKKTNRTESEDFLMRELFYRLGEFHESGWGTVAAANRARACYKLASEKFSNEDAIFKYAQFCEKGIGGAIDNDIAFKNYTWLSGKDYKDSFYPLGTMYYLGKGTEKKIDQAIRWLQKSYDSGCQNAFEQLQDLYITTEDAVALLNLMKTNKERIQKAQSIIKTGEAEYLAGEAGLKSSLSHKTYFGLGDSWQKKHCQEKTALYEDAIKKGFSVTDAKFKIAFCWYRLASGRCNRKPDSYIASLYLESAITGHAEAQYEYADILMLNDGSDDESAISEDKKKRLAIQWLQKSADQEFNLAQFKLAQLFEENDSAKAVEYYTKTLMNQKVYNSYLYLIEKSVSNFTINHRAAWKLEDLFKEDLSKHALSEKWEEDSAKIQEMNAYFAEEIPTFVKIHDRNSETIKSLEKLEKLAKSALFLLEKRQDPCYFLTAYEPQDTVKKGLEKLYINRPDGTRLLSLLPLPEDFMVDIFDGISFFPEEDSTANSVSSKQHLFFELATLIKETTPIRNLLMAKALIDNRVEY